MTLPVAPPWQLTGWRARSAAPLTALGLAHVDAPLVRLQRGIAASAAVVASNAAEAAAWAAAAPDGILAQTLGNTLLLATDPGHLAETRRWLTPGPRRSRQSRRALWQLLGAPLCCADAAASRGLEPVDLPADAFAAQGLLGRGGPIVAAWFPPCRPDCDAARQVVGKLVDATGAGKAIRAALPEAPPAWLWPADGSCPGRMREVRVAPGQITALWRYQEQAVRVVLTPGDQTAQAFQAANGLCLTLGGDLAATSQSALLVWWAWLQERAELVLAAMAPAAPASRHRPTRALPGEPIAPRKRVLGKRDVERFFHVDYEWGDGKQASQVTRVGIIYRCNQWCAFCALSEMDVEVPTDQVLQALQHGRQVGSSRLILTGGEPTLNKDLPRLIAEAKALGYHHVTVQTNAVRLADGPLLSRLVDAGLDQVQVSLHGADSAFSDWLTQAPGTHVRTVAGVTRLLEHGIHVLLNGLLFAPTLDQIQAYVDLCTEHWLRHAHRIVLQFRMPSQEFDDPELARRLMPRYFAFVPAVLAASELAAARGFQVADPRQPVTAPSWCVLAAAGVEVGEWLARPPEAVHHAWESEWFTRVAACAACPAALRCPGVRKDYLALFGDAEFAALELGGAGR